MLKVDVILHRKFPQYFGAIQHRKHAHNNLVLHCISSLTSLKFVLVVELAFNASRSEFQPIVHTQQTDKTQQEECWVKCHNSRYATYVVSTAIILTIVLDTSKHILIAKTIHQGMLNSPLHFRLRPRHIPSNPPKTKRKDTTSIKTQRQKHH